MRLKFIYVVMAITILVSVGIGVNYKSTYTDFNAQEKPLNNFAIALMSDGLLEMQIEVMEESLQDSNIILAVRCKDNFSYHFACVTQQVEVLEVFRGESIKVGDIIDVARASTLVSMDKDALINGKGMCNMGFVNEMVPGKIYLIYLEHRVTTHDEDVNIYIQSNEFILAPIFCYEEIENRPCEDLDGNCYVDYVDVEKNEFFLMSQEGIDKITDFKKRLISMYKYKT